MAKFRKVHTAFWDDPLIEKLSPDVRYFYLFLMTNPLCTECGIYAITIKKMRDYTGYNEDAIKALIKCLEVENQRIVYDTSTNEVCLLKKPNYIDRLGKPVVDCLKSELVKVKNKKLIERQKQHIEKDAIRYVYDTCTISRQEKEEEKEKEEETYRKPIRKEVGSERVREVANEVWKDQAWKEMMCMSLSVSMEEFKIWLSKFNASVSGDEIDDFDKSSYKKLSRGWIIKRKAAGETVEIGQQKKSDAPTLKNLNGN